MGIKSISIAATTAIVLSTSVNAAVISIDWQTTGDNLITQDTVSGLNWLDLTETNNMSYNTVSAQLGAGGQFEGFRYATMDEVAGLWTNFGVDLSGTGGTLVAGSIDTGIMDAASYLGNIQEEYNAIAYSGLIGITADFAPYASTPHWAMGAYYNHISGDNNYGAMEALLKCNDICADVGTGSYLVEVSAVPVPAAVWLFGSGLFGLIGVARRNKA